MDAPREARGPQFLVSGGASPGPFAPRPELSAGPRHLCGPQLVFRKPWGELAQL